MGSKSLLNRPLSSATNGNVFTAYSPFSALDNAFFTVESVKFGPNNILSMDYPFLDIQNIESTSDSLLLMLIQDVSQRICYRIITNHVLKSTIL